MPALTAAQRERIPLWSLKHNGWGDGSGYPGRRNNPACRYVGHGLEYSCADGATATYGHAGLPMVSMQPGMAEGAAYVPDIYNYAKLHGGRRFSWQAQVGDLLLIDTGSGAQPGHVEVVYDVEQHGDAILLYSVGWDSGPSNVDRHVGQGGVHKHVWSTSVGTGNGAIICAVDADIIVDWARINAKPKRRRRRTPIHKTVTSKPVPAPSRPAKGRPVITIRHIATAIATYLGAAVVQLLAQPHPHVDRTLLISLAPGLVAAIAHALGDKLTTDQAARAEKSILAVVEPLAARIEAIEHPPQTVAPQTS